jgi:mono/diheme cytochrome c family protein
MTTAPDDPAVATTLRQVCDCSPNARRELMPRNAALTAALAVVAMLVLALCGCAKTSTATMTESGATSVPVSMSSSLANDVNVVGSVARGTTVFGANCAVCHGAHGKEGGVGPSLRNERLRKNSAETIAWIKNPVAPMPKLYPKPLNERDVEDVAAYVQSL